MRRITGLWPDLLSSLAAARGSLLPWAPVFLAIGIGAYFSAAREPAALLLAGLLGSLGAVIWIALRGPDDWQIPARGLALVLAGFLLAALRAHMVAAPVLPFRYYGAVAGRIVGIDRSFSDQPRLTLDQVALDDVAPEKTPDLVRIALHDDSADLVPEPGMIVQMTAHLSPPDGPTEPGGFDFQRLAWFAGIGAVGYSNSPAVLVAPAEGGLTLAAFRMRIALARAMEARMPGQPGAFAAALMTGDRSALDASTTGDLRGANLSHMIAISGLHMGMLTGFVFALCRYGLALVPALALRINVKKMAAFVALLAATFYLVLAGPSVSTRRAYVMAAVILLAVLIDRRAISLRSVAIAALICLTLEPESLVEPGFQMSFAATIALITCFEGWPRIQSYLPKRVRPVAMALASSMIAGAATAPFSAIHFNRIAEYGLLANLLAVPVMGMVVMPAGVLAGLLGPLHLAGPALWVMDMGCTLILAIAHWVASFRGALVPVPTPQPAVLPLIAFAGVLLLVGGRLWLRSLGAGGVVVALALWSLTARPTLLVSADASLVGLMTPAGRALSKPKGAGFVAANWLENDGDPADQPAAYGRDGFSGQKGALSATLNGSPLRVFFGKGALSRAEGACTPGAVLVLTETWPGEPPADCRIFDPDRLQATGAVALYAADGRITVVSARETAGDRLWNRIRLRPPRAKAKAAPPADDSAPSGAADTP